MKFTEFIKTLSLTNKILFGVSAVVIFGLGIFGIIYAVLTQMDRGLMKTKTDYPVHWHTENLPLSVIYHPGLEENMLYVDRHLKEMNRIFSARLFLLGALCPTKDLWDALSDSIANKTAKHMQVLIEPDWAEGIKGQTQLIWDERDGRILAAKVVISGEFLSENPDSPLSNELLHELGHVIGLNHDDDSDSLMHNIIYNHRNQQYTNKDIELIKDTYNANR
jgi:hypothetical protein